MSDLKRSLLSPAARVQAPWIKVTIGKYTFGVYHREKKKTKNDQGMYTQYNVQYPNYIQSLNITKINGQVNQYTLSIVYPVTLSDDPNFFAKIFSSDSKTREITFSYGDMSMPNYVYRDEKAIITSVSERFNLQAGTISYTVKATSSAALNAAGSWTFNGGKIKPSDEIKRIFKTSKYGLQKLFPGMNNTNLDMLIESTDKVVSVDAKRNISALDYISYLVSCMIPQGWTTGQMASSDIYIMTMHDDTSFDESTVNGETINGAYFRVKRVSYKIDKADAFQIDIGFGNSGTVVTAFDITDDQSYSLLYDYESDLEQSQYVKRLNNDGQWEDVWAPSITSKNSTFSTGPDDITWWTKITKFPIKASITILGLLRPAVLMNYIRINVLFPGGNKHISSGLYLVTQQQDTIDGNGYRTTLSLTKIGGDANPTI